MATCDMGHEHEEAASVPLPDPVIIDHGPNQNDVAIAEIEAAASVEREKLWTAQEGMRLESEVQELRGELRGMREVLDRVAPPPEPDPQPIPVPIAVPGPEPAADPIAASPPEIETNPKKAKDGGWWGGYK